MKYLYDTRKDSYRFTETPVDFFVNVGLQVTRRCNMHCSYCSEADLMPDFSLKEIKPIIDKLVGAGLRRICITGGEPLLRKDIVDILKYIKEKGITSTFSTNGYELSAKKLHEMTPYISNIRFSIRGSEEVHDKVTGVRGSYQATVEAIKLSKKLGVPVSVVMTVISENYASMKSIARLCEKLGVEKLYYFSLIPRGRAMKKFARESVSIDKITREYNSIMEETRDRGWNMDIKVANFTIEGECVLIFPNGDVVGVPSFTDDLKQKVIGNLFKESPRKMWENYPFKENYINYYRNH